MESTQQSLTGRKEESPSLLTAIEARLDAASPGPWFWSEEAPDGSRDLGMYRLVSIRTKQRLWFARPKAQDASFLAHVHRDLAALIARVHELEAENAALNEMLLIGAAQ